MRTLTIEAASLSSALGFCRALREFPVVLEERDGIHFVCVAFQRDSDIPLVLQALAENVKTRSLDARHLAVVVDRGAAEDMAEAVMASAMEQVERSRESSKVDDDGEWPESDAQHR